MNANGTPADGKQAGSTVTPLVACPAVLNYPVTMYNRQRLRVANPAFITHRVMTDVIVPGDGLLKPQFEWLCTIVVHRSALLSGTWVPVRDGLPFTHVIGKALPEVSLVNYILPLMTVGEIRYYDFSWVDFLKHGNLIMGNPDNLNAPKPRMDTEVWSYDIMLLSFIPGKDISPRANWSIAKRVVESAPQNTALVMPEHGATIEYQYKREEGDEWVSTTQLLGDNYCHSRPKMLDFVLQHCAVNEVAHITNVGSMFIPSYFVRVRNVVPYPVSTRSTSEVWSYCVAEYTKLQSNLGLERFFYTARRILHIGSELCKLRKAGNRPIEDEQIRLFRYTAWYCLIAGSSIFGIDWAMRDIETQARMATGTDEFASQYFQESDITGPVHCHSCLNVHGGVSTMARFRFTGEVGLHGHCWTSMRKPPTSIPALACVVNYEGLDVEITNGRTDSIVVMDYGRAGKVRVPPGDVRSARLAYVHAEGFAAYEVMGTTIWTRTGAVRLVVKLLEY